MKYVLIVPKSVPPKQVQPSAKAKRISDDKGAIHVRPGTLILTKDEIEAVKAEYPNEAKLFSVQKLVERPKGEKPSVPVTEEPAPVEEKEKPAADNGKKSSNKSRK